jgi:CBS domain-containing protein
MTVEQRNIVVCPSCGSENIEGVDTCENCLMDLRSIDVPEGDQIASDSDLARPISSVRLSKPRTIPVDATVREAVRVMQGDASGAVVVTDGAEIAGIFTERDLLKKVANLPGDLDRPVAAFMTPDPVVLRDTDMMAWALNKMGDGGFRHIPVVRNGQLVGIITARDIMQWVLGRYFD